MNSLGAPRGVKRSGFVRYDPWPAGLRPVTCLVGCNMSFRREVFRRYRFDEWYDGYGLGEDAGLLVPRLPGLPARADAARARLLHRVSPVARDRLAARHEMARVNHYYFVRKNLPPTLVTWLCFLWSEVGEVVSIAKTADRAALAGVVRGYRRILEHAPAARRPEGGHAMSLAPLASVVVPAFNAEGTIGACIEALLGQDYPADRLEVIAVDNRSTDGTAAAMRRYPVRVLSERRLQSSYAARNTGLAVARGHVLLFTDADCVPEPEWARRLVAALADDDAGGAAGRIEAVPGGTFVERFQVEAGVLDAARAFTRPALPFAQTANAAYRRVVFERVGFFDPTLVSGGDLDFAWRMQRAGWGLAYAPGAVVRHQHRRTFRGLVRLYAKNAHGAALLGERYVSFAPRRSLRVPLCRVKEMGGRRAPLRGRPRGGAPAARPLCGRAAALPLRPPPRRPDRMVPLARRPRPAAEALGYLSTRPDDVREAV